jgi:hypothetical protein|tara:strand:- start:2253 stop:2720 length:468 start_codon:yes stop_codon:yes gene_type:complete
MRSDYLNENSSLTGTYVKKVKKITENYTVTEADSGTTFLVHPAATTELDLPTVADLPVGWNCEVWVTEDTDGSDGGMGGIVNIDFGSGADVVGHIASVADAAGDTAVNNDDFINFTAAASPGDNVQIWTDGNRWYVRGIAAALGSDVKFHTDAAS